MEKDLVVNGQDYINLIMVFVPIGIVITALLNGFSAAGSGLMAMYLIVPLSFLNPEIREKPYKIILFFSISIIGFFFILIF